MNFLSHFYHELPCEDAYFTAGVILPDILSNFSSRSGEVVKLFPKKIVDTESVEIKSLIKGVKRHHVVDAYFHASEYFKENTDFITTTIKNKNLKSIEKRLFAISHVLLEIMLDRKILLEDRKSCDMFYILLNKVNYDHITVLVKANTDAREPSLIAKHFSSFTASKFIYEYINDDRLTNLISNLSIRLGNKPFPPTDQKLFKSIIYDIENAILSQKFPKFPSDS